MVRLADRFRGMVLCLTIALAPLSLRGQAPGDAPLPPDSTGTVPGAIGNWPELDSTDHPYFSDSPPPLDKRSPAAESSATLHRFEPAETIAQVGDQFILKGELLGDANLLLASEFARISRLPTEEQSPARSALLAQRDQVMEQLLQLAIDRKLMYLEYLRSMPKAPDEKKEQERRKEISRRVSAYFTKQLTETAAKVRTAGPERYQEFIKQNYQLFRIALVMKTAGIEAPDDPKLERLLRDNGTSLEFQQQAFMERALGQSAVGRNLEFKHEVTHDQLLAHYHENSAEFQVPTRARWEQLSVLFKRFPNKQAAGQAIADLGNQVLFGGAPLDAVAKKHSQEKYAERGGFHDWTVYGDLGISRPINDAVFSLPLNELSYIIEDEDGLHILRVLERQESHFTPFTEAQVEIKQKLTDEQRNKAYKDYIAGLKQRTPVWTVYDELPGNRLVRPVSGLDR